MANNTHTIRVDAALYKALKLYCKNNGTRLSWVLNEALKRWLGK